MGHEGDSRASPVAVVNIDGDDQGIKGEEVTMVDMAAPTSDVRVCVYVSLEGVQVMPLCEERPKGALEAPVGAVGRVLSDMCLLAVIEEGEVEIDDLICEPCIRSQCPEGVRV